MSDEATIEPELRAFLTQISADVTKMGVAAGDLAAMRHASASARVPWQIGGPDLSSENIDFLGMPARLFRPSVAEVSPVLIYLHGGGWMMLGLDTHDRLCREYSDASGWAVVALDYPLAPEAPFPGALDAICAAVQKLVEHADRLRLDCTRIVVGGDSSGANLAIALALRSPSSSIVGLLLLYGVLDSDTSRRSYQSYSAAPHLLTADKMEFFWGQYCRTNAQRLDPLAAPMRATDDDLRLIPPVCMIVAGQDVLADENDAMSARLTALGRHPHVLRYPNATHAFMEAISVSPVARQALDASASWLRGLAMNDQSERTSNTPRTTGDAAEHSQRARRI